MSKSKVLILILVLVFLATGFYFKNNILSLYNNTVKNLPTFNKTDLGNVVNEIKKEIFSPPPLNIGGQRNEAVLIKSKIIAETNIQRYNNGNLPPLIENTKLYLAAKAKADDMFKKQYFEHISPSGVDPGTLVKSFSYDYIVSGENLILGNFEDEKDVVGHWMASPGHRANILNNRFVEIGVAVVKGIYEGQTVWIGVQEFGLPLSSCPEQDINLKNQIGENKNILDQLSLQIDAKKNEIENTNQKSSKYNFLVNEYNQLIAKYNPLNDQTKNLILQYNNQVNNFNNCVVGE
ncbi:MAG: hypothetical protein A3C58_02955 [Candidatus Staskawiczbacteria bacterium RIFCSPHIGHO2_02_FULL_34_10]|uniref:SCP domain-containing protein n=2 Tax=Candidatus Staskawicziibacteriota TaxID=1817916 RepID=A0A1G2HLF9_9BACT|nr:MAG: hypothetical protein A2639_00170 [Candidatus Staskawiczbacteria bacterium RIFCSPHIGHO2_01_FULL_34_27]OGZ67007.1 MAG: hypothetical protein A3C58_02955 [Candidatus Staskawiczbacteria bacterium RIFCSPHIGHO2_02_FULL_34_10]